MKYLLQLIALLSACLGRFFPNRATVTFANIGEGRAENGNKTYAADAAIATRYFCVEIGSDADHVAVSNAATDIPLGICDDAAEAAEDLVNVNLFGAYKGTMLGVAGGSISAGDFLVSAGNGKLQALPAAPATYYIIGRALKDASADEQFEFAPSAPVQRVVT